MFVSIDVVDLYRDAEVVAGPDCLRSELLL